jgi:hypothetical protein
MLATFDDFTHVVVGQTIVEAMISQAARGDRFLDVAPAVVFVSELSEIVRAGGMAEGCNEHEYESERAGEGPFHTDSMRHRGSMPCGEAKVIPR